MGISDSSTFIPHSRARIHTCPCAVGCASDERAGESRGDSAGRERSGARERGKKGCAHGRGERDYYYYYYDDDDDYDYDDDDDDDDYYSYYLARDVDSAEVIAGVWLREALCVGVGDHLGELHARLKRVEEVRKCPRKYALDFVHLCEYEDE